MSRRKVLLAVAGILVFALTASAGVLAFQLRAGNERDAAREAAMKAARTAVPAVLSYSYKTLDADLNRARSRLTGNFSDEYSQVAASVVVPNATKDHVVTTASLTGVSVMTSSVSSARLLLFVNQSTTSSSKPTAINASRVVATMNRVGGTWLISDLRAV